MIARGLLGGIFIALSASGALAQQLTVRSGEHGAFSRLVIPYPQGTAWEVSQTEKGIRLTPTGSGYAYDLREIFRFIPKTRISSVRAEVGRAGLFIEASVPVHTKAFQLANGAVVLDVIDGPPETLATEPPPMAETFAGAPAMPHLDVFWKGKAPRTVGAPAAPPNNPLALAVPSGRVSEAEQELLANLSRATAQGIFRVDMMHNPLKGKAAEAQPEAPAPTAAESEDDGLAILSQTVIDRDLITSSEETRLLITGRRCFPDQAFDLQAWINDQPPSQQIAAARADLVGEFDRPDSKAALKLARIYLALGFGAESKDVLRSFSMTSRTAQAYSFMADIMEETQPPQDSPIIGMVGCNTKAAMWALLGSPTLPQQDQVDLNAVQAAFSALPPGIRTLLGPDLADRLLAIGARDTAQAVRNALGRIPGEKGASLALVEARLDMSNGDHAAAERKLEPIANSSEAASARALSMAIDARLERGRTVDRESIENAAALAKILGDSPDGLLLRRATALGEGSSGAFDPAFAALDAWPAAATKDLQIKARRELYAQLAKVPDEQIFLSQILRRQEDALAAGLPESLQIDFSTRLADAGFAREAKAIIDDMTKATPGGRLALARASLAEPDPAAAISHLEGLDGERANQMRAEALSRLGEHAVAAQIYAGDGDTKQAGAEAWRAGDWALVSEYGSGMQKQATSTLISAPIAGQGDAPVRGLLTRSNRLLEESQKERQLIDQLLAQ